MKSTLQLFIAPASENEGASSGGPGLAGALRSFVAATASPFIVPAYGGYYDKESEQVGVGVGGVL